MAHVVCLRHGGSHLILPLVTKLHNGPVNDVLKHRRQLFFRQGKFRFTPPVGKKIICWRDPRDLIISKIRHTRKRRRPNIAIKKEKAVLQFLREDRVVYPDAGGVGHVEQLLRTARRWEDVDGLRIPFETITDSAKGPAAADEIAEYLGARDGAGWYRKIHGMGKTYNKRRSDWREWFGEESLAIFAAKGGRELVERLGYEWFMPTEYSGHELYCPADDGR